MATPQQTGLFYMGTAPQAVLTGFPVDFNRRVFKQLDSTFLIILAVSFVVMGSTFFILSLRTPPEAFSEKEILKIQERYAQLILNQPKPKVEEAVEEVEVTSEDTREGSGKEEEKEKVEVDRKSESVVQKKQRKEASSADRRKKRENISQQLQSSGIFAAITSTGAGVTSSGSSQVTDLLGTASEGIGDIGDIDISKGTFATKDVDPKQVLKSRRGARKTGVGIEKESVGRVSGSQIASVGKVNITTKPPQIKGESAGKGSRSVAAINRVVTRQQSRLKKVYESMLKRDPNLKGKLKVKFTIMPDGSVTSVSVVESTTNNATFNKRILSYIKRWKFPPISGGGPVEVIYPFVFSGSA